MPQILKGVVEGNQSSPRPAAMVAYPHPAGTSAIQNLGAMFSATKAKRQS